MSNVGNKWMIFLLKKNRALVEEDRHGAKRRMRGNLETEILSQTEKVHTKNTEKSHVMKRILIV